MVVLSPRAVLRGDDALVLDKPTAELQSMPSSAEAPRNSHYGSFPGAAAAETYVGPEFLTGSDQRKSVASSASIYATGFDGK